MYKLTEIKRGQKLARKNGGGRQIPAILSDTQKLIYSAKHVDYSEKNYK